MPDDPTLFPDDDPDPYDPARAYGDTSGWSGSETSRERAERDDASGRTSARDTSTMEAVGHARDKGLTWFELADLHHLHHGEASAALSRLHRHGALDRLVEKRGGSQIYVLHPYTEGRPTAPYRPNVSRKAILELLGDIDERLAVADIRVARRIIHFARERYGKGIPT